MVNGEDRLEQIRMEKDRPGIISRARAKLQSFREKQIAFGNQARDRAISRETQKVELAKLKTERKQVESTGRQAVSRARLSEIQVNRTSGGGMFGSSGGFGSVAGGGSRKRKLRIRTKQARTSLSGGRKVRARVRRSKPRESSNGNPFGSGSSGSF